MSDKLQIILSLFTGTIIGFGTAAILASRKIEECEERLDSAKSLIVKLLDIIEKDGAGAKKP